MKTPGKSPRRSKDAPAAATLSLRIQPRASKNEILRMESGELKVRLTAPPVDGAANEALVKFLAAQLGVAKSNVEIVSGHMSREKIVRVNGISPVDMDKILNGERK